MAAKKNTRKKVSAPKNVSRMAKVESVEAVQAVDPTAEMQPSSVNKPVSIILIIVLLFIILYFTRSAFVVAVVNGEPISRSTYNHELAKDAGKKAIGDLISNILILQEAKKKNITVSDSEINSEIKKFEASAKSAGTTLTQQLKDNNFSVDDLKMAIRVNAALKKLMAKQLIVTDKEVNDYIDKSKTPGSEEPVTTAMKANIKAQLQSQKFQMQAPGFIDGLRKKAKINYYIQQ